MLNYGLSIWIKSNIYIHTSLGDICNKKLLELEILIVVGASVMLTSNLWTDVGLINGALGVIQQIVYNLGSSPPEPPTYVLIKFYKYVGAP